MGKKRSLPSVSEQIKVLKQKKILTKDGRNPSSGRRVSTKWSVYRLYKFYVIDGNSANRPVFEAYAQQKRTFSRLEEKGDAAKVSTPRGKRSGRQYIRSIDTKTGRSLAKGLSPNVSPRFGKYYKTVQHVRDEFTYRIEPPITATQATISKANKRAGDVSDDIVSILNRFLSARRSLYRNHAVGAIVTYRTKNVETASGITNPEGYIRIPWIRIYDVDIFKTALIEGFETALDIVFKYPGGSMSIRKVDVYISTVWRGTNIDLLRARN